MGRKRIRTRRIGDQYKAENVATLGYGLFCLINKGLYCFATRKET